MADYKRGKGLEDEEDDGSLDAKKSRVEKQVSLLEVPEEPLEAVPTGRSSVFGRLGKGRNRRHNQRGKVSRSIDLRATLSRKSEVKPYHFNLLNNVEVENAGIFDKTLPNPAVELQRAGAMERLIGVYKQACQVHLDLDAPLPSLSRWVYQQLSEPIGNIEADSVFRSPESISDSTILTDELLREIPGRIPGRAYRDWNIGNNAIKKFVERADAWLNQLRFKHKDDPIDEQLEPAVAILTEARAWLETSQYDDEATQEQLNTLLNKLRDDCSETFRGFVKDEVLQVCQALATQLAEELLTLQDMPKVIEPDNVEAAESLPVLEELPNRSSRVTYKEHEIVLKEGVVKKLRELYAIHNSEMDKEGAFFPLMLYCCAVRYQTIHFTQHGVDFEAALPPAFLSALTTTFETCFDGFASPFNTFTRNFTSGAPDLDVHFGSVGSFFQFEPSKGSFQLHPPFVEQVVDKLALRLEELLSNGTGPLSFVVLMPDWRAYDSTALELLEGSAHYRGHFPVLGSNQSMISGNAPFVVTESEAWRRTPFAKFNVYFMQNEAGSKAWPVTEDKLGVLKRSLGVRS
eukprot:m.62299 g.62299  ORF g.62299 m.62299 type:complete len:574 (+) comp13927_c0_seq1:3-1724(+)